MQQPKWLSELLCYMKVVKTLKSTYYMNPLIWNSREDKTLVTKWDQWLPRGRGQGKESIGIGMRKLFGG